MKIKKKEVNEVLVDLKEVEDLLTERLVELADIPGGMQARHAYIFYRNKVMYARLKLRDAIEINPT